MICISNAAPLSIDHKRENGALFPQDRASVDRYLFEQYLNDSEGLEAPTVLSCQAISPRWLQLAVRKMVFVVLRVAACFLRGPLSHKICELIGAGLESAVRPIR